MKIMPIIAKTNTMKNKFEQLEKLEIMRDQMWDQLNDLNDEYKRLLGLHDAWVIPMCGRKEMFESQLKISNAKDQVKMMLKSYAVITGEIQRICLDQ